MPREPACCALTCPLIRPLIHRSMVRRHALALAVCALAAAHAPLLAQTSPARGPLAPAGAAAPAGTAPGDSMPLADYLGLLRQIAPAAEDGARTYLAAARLRCGRELNTAELRLAMAQDGGDPVLMGLIRAAHQQDRGARQQLVAQVRCPSGGTR
ncbi:hypothetical protein [Paracidovorax anthurii]|uniref:Uncharacterized protein n=1 Tax=Paracidovorax anthurii TaxID=78229 RepID=A0A328ZG95_9BURK|nr:hypothetical protein [Paracidovorax anthurii]RAR83572.1 hypothetical protein AX018_101481 [Paracidovorax anthurii]